MLNTMQKTAPLLVVYFKIHFFLCNPLHYPGVTYVTITCWLINDYDTLSLRNRLHSVPHYSTSSCLYIDKKESPRRAGVTKFRLPALRRRPALMKGERQLERTSDNWETRKLKISATTVGRCGPDQPRIQAEVLGHSLVRSLIRTHRSLCSLC